MKSYPSISGINSKDFPWGEYGYFFNKLDGTNIRAEWSPKRGFYKFGTRNQLFDNTNLYFNKSIDIINNKFANDLEKIFYQEYKKIDSIVCFFEYFGEESFAGWHNYEKDFQLKLIDVSVLKKGIIGPKEYLKNFGNLDIAELIYEGEINKAIVEDFINNKYNLFEGVVVKGNFKDKKELHSLFMFKIKTKLWLDKLEQNVCSNNSLLNVLNDNLREQILN